MSLTPLGHRVNVRVSVNDVHCDVCALLDTGSPASFISEDVLKRLSHPISPLSTSDSSPRFSHSNGVPVPILGHVMLKLCIMPHSVCLSVHFWVVSDRSFCESIILGRTFLHDAGIGLYLNPHSTHAMSESVHVEDIICVRDGVLHCMSVDQGPSHDSSLTDHSHLIEVEVPEDPDDDVGLPLITGVTDIQDPKIRAILQRFPDITKSAIGTTPCSVTSHKIELLDSARPYKRTYYRVAPDAKQFIDDQIAELLRLGVIVPSRSQWGSPIVLVRKGDGTFRMCIDYRRLNDVTVPEVFPLPYLEDTFDKMSGKSVFSVLDLKSGYWQVAMDPASAHLTAFISHRGLFEWRRMPFGLRNAVSTFQRLMRQVLSGLEQFSEVHVDDIIIFSSSYEEHLDHLTQVLSRLADAKLVLKLPNATLPSQSSSSSGIYSLVWVSGLTLTRLEDYWLSPILTRSRRLAHSLVHAATIVASSATSLRLPSLSSSVPRSLLSLHGARPSVKPSLLSRLSLHAIPSFIIPISRSRSS